METTTWQSRVVDYVEYNRVFVENERQEVVAMEAKRRSYPRSRRIQKGELVEATQVRRLKMFKYEFTTMRPLMYNHQFQSGQVVELRIGDNRRGGDGLREEMKFENCTIVLKGTVTTKSNEHVLLRRLEIEFSEDSTEHLLFKYIGSHTPEESGVLVFNYADAMRMEIEISSDTTTFDRMEYALSTLAMLKSKPVWLSAAIGSRVSSCTFKKMVNEASTIDVSEASPVGHLVDRATTSTESSLNSSQQQAVDYSLRSALTLIHGPPGTGKTHTAAALVKAWLKRTSGRVALVVAQSNKAVDQMALSLIAIGQTPLRVGSMSKIHKGIYPYHVMQQVKEKTKDRTEDEKDEKRDLVAEIVGKSDVICSTCIGAVHKHLQSLDRRKVGLIIMDEATQASEPECLVPLSAFRHARVVLIGDQMQLPPTILSDAVRRSNQEYSLFGRLIEYADETGQDAAAISKAMLTTQYRMHPEIASFSNQQFYDGKLQNGVAASDRKHLPPKSLWPIVSTRRSPVLFIESTGEEDLGNNTSFSNREEANVVVAIVRRLLQCGVARGQIGVITPYMGQVRLLRQLLTACSRVFSSEQSSNGDTLEINSVDAFQGSEKEIIVISAVRSNASGTVGFLKDFRRLNVALTRARRGLVVIGNPETLQHDEHWKAWLDHTKNNRRLVQDILPQAAVAPPWRRNERPLPKSQQKKRGPQSGEKRGPKKQSSCNHNKRRRQD